MLRTGNPTLQVFQKPQTWDELEAAAPAAPRTMTVAGVVSATAILVGITMCSAVGGWVLVQNNPQLLHPMWITAVVLGLVAGFGLRSKPLWARFVAPVYAVIEGVFLGGFSFFIAQMASAQFQINGNTMILQAVLLTFGILLAMLIGYASGLLRLGGMAKKLVVVATGGIMIYYMISILLSFILPNSGFGALMSFNNGSPISIGFSVVVLVIASLNLILDFDLVREGVKSGQPKAMEWYAGFALLVTLVWLYIEILRLMYKIYAATRD